MSGKDRAVPAPSLFCPHCGYAPLLIRGGPLTPENLDRISVVCPGCAWPFGREEIAGMVERRSRGGRWEE